MHIVPDNFISTGTQDQAVVSYLNDLFITAMRRQISDIHVLIQGEKCYIQFRDAGVIVDHDIVTHTFGDMIDSKIRSRADLNKADSHVPVDGRMALRYPDSEVGADTESMRKIDVRVSITPTVAGRKIVCRLLDEKSGGRRLAEIPMSLMVRRCIDEIINQPNGLFVV